MTSTIKVNTITTESGSTLTIGGCGKTVALASGASQTGFGRTGTVDWQTGSIKTATFTAVNGQGFFADTSSGGFTMNLPAGTAGNIVSVVDYTNTFQNNALTISPNGSQKIGGVNANFVANTEGQSLTFVYVDDTEGWKNVQDSTSNATGNAFLVATGGTTTCCGNFKIHTFTGPGTFTVSQTAVCSANNAVDYLVVAGGAAGGMSNGNQGSAGGGGAGGFRVSNDTCMPAPQTSPLANPSGITVTATAFPITVGAGGAAISGPNNVVGNSGSNSIFSTITSAGGGGGGGSASPAAAVAGGSGGGGRAGPNNSGGAGNTPPVSPPQGNAGGDGPSSPGDSAGISAGGGGAGQVGQSANGGSGSFVVGAGFAGCNGTPGPVSGARYFAGGGGRGGACTPACNSGGAGGTGGGGAGGDKGPSGAAAGTAGTANTGGGGGASGSLPGPSNGAGGSGIVILRYKYK
jgi:hypothetical protein